MPDRASQRSGDPGDALNLGDNELAEIVNVVCLGPDDHVIGTCNVIRLCHAIDLTDVRGDVGRLADLCLDEDISLNHAVLPGTPNVWLRYPTYPSGGRRLCPAHSDAGPPS